MTLRLQLRVVSMIMRLTVAAMAMVGTAGPLDDHLLGEVDVLVGPRQVDLGHGAHVAAVVVKAGAVGELRR